MIFYRIEEYGDQLLNNRLHQSILNFIIKTFIFMRKKKNMNKVIIWFKYIYEFFLTLNGLTPLP